MAVEVKTHQQVWVERFEQAATNPFSYTQQWIETGILRGLAPDDTEGRLNLAREMGTIMSFVLPEGQPEIFREDLNLNTLANTLNQTQKRIEEVVDLMVEVEAIISRKRRELIKQRNGRKY